MSCDNEIICALQEKAEPAYDVWGGRLVFVNGDEEEALRHSRAFLGSFATLYASNFIGYIPESKGSKCIRVYTY